MKLIDFLNLNEAPRDILSTDKSVVAPEATRVIDRSVRKQKKEPVRVRVVGSDNPNEPNEMNADEFYEKLSHISGTAAFSKNINNPTVIGRNEINPFVFSEIAKMFLFNASVSGKTVGNVLKDLSRKREGTLNQILSKMKLLISKINVEYVADIVPKMGEKRAKEVVDKLLTISTINNIETLSNFISQLKRMNGYKLFMREYSNRARYAKKGSTSKPTLL